MNINFFDLKSNNLQNIYYDKILFDNLNNNALENLSRISYNLIFDWWKNETITYFDNKNDIICTYVSKDINNIQKIKKNLISISQIEDVLLESLNSNKINLKIIYFGNKIELFNILKFSNFTVKQEKNKCFLEYDPI